MRLRRNPQFPEGINASEENPLKEFFLLLAGISITVVVLVFLLSLLAHSLSRHVPFTWEQAVADHFVENMMTSADAEAQQGAASSVDPARFEAAENAIQALGAALQQSMALPPEIELRFHLIEEDMPNAFATLGGHIFVTTGLLDVLSSENALAMVMAHEMAHIKYRHPIQAMSRGALIQLLLAIITGADGSASVQGLLSQTGLFTVLSFNRGMESSADREARELMINHYGHLAGADEFFRQMLSQTEGQRWPEFFSTHPGLENRIDQLKADARHADKGNDPIPMSPDIQALKDSGL